MASFSQSFLSKKEAVNRINTFSKAKTPFLFIIDYKACNSLIIKSEDVNSSEILYDFGVFSNCNSKEKFSLKKIDWDIKPISAFIYNQKINFVINQIKLGNSFLVNFTQPTKIKTNLTLKEIFYSAKTKYKLWLKDWFVVFSPEIFVKIEDGKISSYPMKGTIDANLPDAENTILNSEKEKAEHATIVDLIRNDLSMIADNVEVKRFRYVEKIRTNQTDLLQVSSHIEGELPGNYKDNLGEIIFKLLPAGSISGAPKPKTLEIIETAEDYERGFYTGICGYFDGEKLESAVMIRFIEQTADGLVFKSGGGITFLSDTTKEYEELIQKVYVPIY